jgi:hypothetical protein
MKEITSYNSILISSSSSSNSNSGSGSIIAVRKLKNWPQVRFPFDADASCPVFVFALTAPAY